MSDCTTVFDALKGFLPVNILKRLLMKPVLTMEPRSLLCTYPVYAPKAHAPFSR